MNERIAMVQSIVWSIVLRIRLRSLILWKHDLEIEEICCANDRFVTKLTPKLRAESTGESMTMKGRWMVGLLSLESCCSRPKMRNSVLEGLRDRKLEDSQLESLVILFSRWVCYEINPEMRMIREVEYHLVVVCWWIRYDSTERSGV